MKKFVANLTIVLGIVIALPGLISTPLIQNFLPASFVPPSGDGRFPHHFFRIVPADPQGPDYLPYVLLLLGITVLIIGLLFRRKLRGIAA